VARTSGAFGFGIVSPIAGFTTLALVTVSGVGVAGADDNFPIAGNYTQNVLCKGDGTDPKEVQVKISAQEIVSNVGVCTILSTKQEGKTTTVHVECKFPAGPLVGDIAFTPRNDKTVEFVDRDGNYKAILHPCPN